MNNLIQTDVKMNSVELSELVEKRHDHVMRDIRNEIKKLGDIGQPIFGESSYINKQNKEQPCYEFGKDGAMQLALKYDAKTRYRVIKRIEELENKQPTASYMIENPIQRAEKWIEEQKEKQHLLELNSKKDQIIGELKPKADYTDVVLNNKSLVTITQIAKDYGMSGQELNKKLNELGIQYKISNQWLLYKKYQDKGYTHSETINFTKKDGTEDVNMITKWKQRGRLFIYEVLKEDGILPMIERDNS